jgi:inner membrane protein
MASIGHLAVGLAAARAQDARPSWRAMLGWSALALLPDIDAVGFMRGVPYGAEWGHRGATHSLALALAGGIATGLGARVLGAHSSKSAARFTVLATLVLASHGLLDTLTDGGLGIALLWPFSLHRFFAPWQPIPVAPIGPAFFSADGAMIAATELVLFLPLWLYAFGIRRRAGVIAAWLVAVWLLTSTDPVREKLVDRVYPAQTRFAAGYSEDFFRTIVPGDREDAVRARLGEPLFDSVFYLPDGYTMESIMAGQVPPGCFGVGVKDAVVHDTHDPGICRSRGLVEGMSRADMVRILGTPAGSCAQYSDGANNGHFRLRMVCFVKGTVERIFRRRT